tara:strand:+ start:4567 stop:4746 length:180 start_codon:yes stop_codon:yes gene_type:complete
MKKYYIAANILGAAEIKAESPEQALKKAEKYSSKRFKLQPKPTGLMIFENPAPDARIEP